MLLLVGVGREGDGVLCCEQIYPNWSLISTTVCEQGFCTSALQTSWSSYCCATAGANPAGRQKPEGAHHCSVIHSVSSIFHNSSMRQGQSKARFI